MFESIEFFEMNDVSIVFLLNIENCVKCCSFVATRVEMRADHSN